MLHPTDSSEGQANSNLARLVARLRNCIHRHCERSEAIHLSPRRDVDCFASFAMTWMGRRAFNTCTHIAIERTQSSLLSQFEHTSPHCCRNSNLPAPMRGRASVQLLPACETYG